MWIAPIETEMTYDLRSRVLRPGLGIETCRFPEDAKSKHFGAFSERRLVSVVSAHPEQNPNFSPTGQWRIRGMATEPDMQGRGPGSLVLGGLLEWGTEKNIPLFWCNAREKAIPFYERHGFQVASEMFDIPTVGFHKVMWIKL